MKKKIFIPILISFILIFGICVIVNAEGGSDGSSGNTGVGNKCDSGYCWLDGTGVRVTLIDTAGNQIGKTNNIIYDNKWYFEIAKKIKSGCSKVEYLKGKCNAGNFTSTSWDNSIISSSTELDPYFTRIDKNASLSSIMGADEKHFENMFKWADENKLSPNDDDVRKLYEKLFGLVGTGEYDSKVLPNINDLWIVIEPMTILYDQNGNYYAGTTYELGLINNGYPGDAISVVRRKLPCQLYITGEIATNESLKAPGVNVADGSYFNGTLKYINNNLSASTDGRTFSNTCSSGSKSILTMDYVTGNYGGGVGLVYFKDTVKSDLTCDTVNKGIPNPSDFNKKLDNAYKTGGINAIYNLQEVRNGIKFTGGVADKYWYINECTCYGAYSAYQPDINKTQLYDLPPLAILNNFNNASGLFINYFNSVSDTIKKQDSSTVGKLTDWNYNKYTTLNCGSADCTEVKFFKIDFSKLENPKMTPEECKEAYGGKFPVLYNQQQLKQCINEYNEYASELKNIENTCKNLSLHGDKNYTKDYINQHIDEYETCFELYNEQFNTIWDIASYTFKDACPPDGDGGEKPKKYNCTPKYNVGTCLNGENIFYSDSSKSLSTEEFWKNCVFDDTNAYYDINVHKVSDKNSSLTYYDKTLSSSYCEIYCTETLTTGFNSDTMNVISGQYFVWNNHSLSGSRTCRTKSIDWNKFNSDLSAAKDQNQANAIYNEMKKCYDPDVWDENIYNLNPTGILTYYYTVNGVQGIYNVNQEMDKNITYTGIGGASDCKDTTVKVGNTNKTIKQCTFVEMRKGATVQFSLPSGLYQYINKENNVSFNANQLESLKSEYLSQGKQLNYLNVGYSNLPVEFKVPEGYYGQLFGNGELSITYSDLGHKIGNNKTAVDTILGVIDSYNYGNWQCDFIVEDNPLIPDPNDPNNPYEPNNPYDPNNPKGPGGINLIYRPIDLYDPFPDIDGSGRNTGSNWCNYNTNGSDCSNDNQVVYDYILNNRDVEGEEIYLEDPMYTFILTPSIIREIRNYNNQNSYTDYYGSLGDKTYDFKCNEGTGKTCISDYLSHLIEITGAKNQPGTCVDDMFRTYNDPNNFEACRYQNSDWPIFNPPSYELPVEKPDISTH